MNSDVLADIYRKSDLLTVEESTPGIHHSDLAHRWLLTNEIVRMCIMIKR